MTSLRYRWLLVGLLLPIWAFAADTAPRFDIPAQSLPEALRLYAHQAKMQLAYKSEAVDVSVKSNGVVGEYEIRVALEQLLKDTGYEAVFSSETTATIRPKQSAGSGKHAEKLSDHIEGENPAAPVARGGESFWDRLLVAQAGQGAAISANSPQAFTSTENSDLALTEVIVTAQRREESVNKVPISITALTQQQMDDLHVEKFADLSNLVPGLYNFPTTGIGQDGESVSIRGIFSNNNAPTTQFYIDETPIAIRQMTGAALSGSPQPLIFDLDHVEVLRGPQGTLFGASAMGGALRFITPQPSVVETSGFAKLDFSQTEHGGPGYEVGAAYGAPIVTGSSGFRVSAWYQSIGGFIDQEDPFTGRIIKSNDNSPGQYVVRPALILKPSENLSITPSLYLQHKDSENDNAYWTGDLPYTEGDKHIWGGTTQPLYDDLRVAGLAIRYDFSDLTFQSDTSYLNRDLRANNDLSQIYQIVYGYTDYLNPGVENFHSDAIDISNNNSWQQEFRLSSQDSSSRITWVAGTYYRHSIEGLRQLITPDLTPLTEFLFGQTSLEANGGIPDYIYRGMPLNAYQDFHTTDISEAAFVDITAKVTSQLIFNVGMRFEHTIVQDQTEVEAGPLDGVTYSSVTLPDQVENPVTPRASITYQITNDDMVYISAAKGERPGGGNPSIAVNVTGGVNSCSTSLATYGLTSVQPTFSSDHLWSYELGTKDLFLDRHLSVAASIYYIDWTNIQTNISLPSCSSNFTANYSKAISQGFDLQVAAVVTDNLKFGLNTGYTNAYYPNQFRGAPQPGTPGPGPLITAEGEKLGGVPWTAAANANYAIDLNDLWRESKGYFRVDYRWQSKTTARNPLDQGFDPTTELFPAPAYGVLNLRLGAKHNGIDLSAYVTNVTNRDPIIDLSHIGESDPLFRANAIQPRTFGLSGWYRF